MSTSLRTLLRRAGTVAALFLLAGPLTAQPQETRPQVPPVFAITNARIVPVSGAGIDRGTVVVAHGVIEAVGRDVTIPADAWILDADGMTVYPGLIDAMSTVALGEREDGQGERDEDAYSWGPEYRPGTFTWHSAADALDPTDERVADWRSAGFTTAVVAPVDGFVPGDATVVNLAGERGREMVVRNRVATRVNLQARGYPGYPGALLGSFAYLKQLYLDGQHYDRVWSAYEADPVGKTRPEWDRALEPIREALGEGRPVLFPADDRNQVQRALATAGVMGLPPVVYGVQGAWDAADVLADAGVSAIVNVDWPTGPRGGVDENTNLRTLRLREWAPTTPASLAGAGVRFGFSSGELGGPDGVMAGIRTAIRGGLDAGDALRALTVWPAEIFGVADRLGTVQEGKIANLVITDGDLFDEGTTVRWSIVDGVPFQAGTGETMAEAEGRGRRGGDAAVTPGTVEPAADRGPYRSDPVTVIRGATIVTMTDRGTIENGTLVMRNGRIAAIGGADVPVPSGARVVDGTGMYLTPGIIDAHSHLAADAINEGSVNVSAMVRMKDVLDPYDVGMYRALAGGVTTINLLHGSANPIGGQNAILKLRWGADAPELVFQEGPEGIKFALGENTKRDRDPDRYPSTRMGVQDVIRQAFVDGQAYMARWEAYEAAVARGDDDALPPRRDLKLEAMAEILRGERDIHAHSYRSDEILQLMRTAEEFGVTIGTFQHVLEGYKVADEIAAHGAGASTFSDWWAYKVEAYDAIPYNAALMTERGVLSSINSDSGEEIRHLNQEAAKSQKWGGLDDEAALALVTRNPAQQLGIDDRVGTLEVGKDADVVLFDGPPLSIDAVPQQTYVDGILYFDVELDRERQRDIRREKEALLEKYGGEAGSGVVTEDMISPAVTDADGVDADTEVNR